MMNDPRMVLAIVRWLTQRLEVVDPNYRAYHEAAREEFPGATDNEIEEAHSRALAVEVENVTKPSH